MARYTLVKGEDDGVWVAEGLEHDFLKGRKATVFQEQGWDFKDMVYEIRKNNKNVQHDDIFVTPGGCFKVDGALMVPYDDTATTTPPPTTGQTAANQQCSCANQPGASCPACQPPPPSANPVTVVGATIVDDQGMAINMNLSLHWPGATSSQILAEVEKQNNPKMPGDIIAVIDIPALNSRVMEVRYGANKLVITVG